MDFHDVVRLHHLNICTVNEIICKHCFRVLVLSGDTLPGSIACPGCGNAARAIRRLVRAATSRELPWAGIVKVKAASLVFVERKLTVVPAIPAVAVAKPNRFERQLVKLGLNGNPQEWRQSEALKVWVENNRHKTFVPEELLRWWNIEVQESDINLAKSGEL